jgi:hypothetical protein
VLLPEAREILRDLHRAPVRRQQVQHQRHAARHTAGPLREPKKSCSRDSIHGGLVRS